MLGGVLAFDSVCRRSGPAAVSWDLEIAAVSSLMRERIVVCFGIITDLKFNGLFSA